MTVIFSLVSKIFPQYFFGLLVPNDNFLGYISVVGIKYFLLVFLTKIISPRWVVKLAGWVKCWLLVLGKIIIFQDINFPSDKTSGNIGRKNSWVPESWNCPEAFSLLSSRQPIFLSLENNKFLGGGLLWYKNYQELNHQIFKAIKISDDKIFLVNFPEW